MIAALQNRKVRFVVVGGIAAIAQGSPLPTEDVDITPERSTDNLEALAAALVDLDPRLRRSSAPRARTRSRVWRAGAHRVPRRRHPVEGGRRTCQGQGAVARSARDARGHPRTRRSPRLAPDFLRHLDDEAQLRPLLLLAEHVALDGGREAALRRQAQLLERRVPRRLLDTPQQLFPRLELAALRRHEPEHDLLLALRQEAQRLEAARALVVPLHEEAVDVELVQERLGDVVPASLGRPRRLEVAAARMRGDAHLGRPPGERLVDMANVLDVLALVVAADRRDVVALMRVVDVREARVVELDVRAAEVAEPPHLFFVRGDEVRPERVQLRIYVLVDRSLAAAVMD